MSVEPGSIVVRRQFQRDDLLGRVWVGRVAADDQYGLWVWIASGSPYRDIGAAYGRDFRDVPFDEWGRTPKTMRELPWTGDMLVLHPHSVPPSPGDPGSAREAYSVWFFFDPDGAFRSWYINLEESVVRWYGVDVMGVDTVDYDLDVVVSPDRGWRWKDEDEFAARLAHPDIYWVDDAARVRAEGERLVKLVEAGEFPFDGTRTTFRPDPLWTMPATMPVGWDRPRVRALNLVSDTVDSAAGQTCVDGTASVVATGDVR